MILPLFPFRLCSDAGAGKEGDHDYQMLIWQGKLPRSPKTGMP
jgi:hypothetical protein